MKQKGGEKMRINKTLSLLLVMFLLATPVFAAGERYGTQFSDAVETTTALVLPANTWVYGTKLFADEASSFMGVYNSATLSNCTGSTVKDEIGEATQYDTAYNVFPKPILFTSGVSVVMDTGVGWIMYGGAP